MRIPANARPVRLARVLLFVLAAAALAWGVSLLITDGVSVRAFGIRLTSSNPLRPILIALISGAAFAALGGRPALIREWARTVVRIDERIVVAMLAVALLAAGVIYSTTAASGSDAYGYVSQAEGWLHGKPTIDQPGVASVPWRSGRWSFTPLGYRPSDDGDTPWTLTPVYAAGLPMLLAMAKAIGGQEGMFWVVPLCGALLVGLTYGLGSRLGNRRAGLIGAWLVATSPAVLFMVMAPMTDVPVAAAWGLACFLLLGAGRGRAFGAGLASSVAIVIRPNLVVMAAALGSLFIIRIWRAERGARLSVLFDGLAFSAGVLPGVVGVALLNHALYGSPFKSGYGSLDGMFTLDHVQPNARRYFLWLAETQTPIVFAGLAAILFPRPLFWPGARRDLFVPLAVFATTLWIYYCFYLVFDQWWYLRFLLSAYPILMVGLGAVAVAAFRQGNQLARVGVTAVVLGLGVHGLWQANVHGVFQVWKDERRYVSAAQLVARYTDDSSVVMAMQHSGSLRYYAGRTTMRFDTLDARHLDYAVTWLASRDIRVFLFVEDWELPRFRRRYAGQETLERLADPPLVTYKGAATMYLFEISRVRDPLMRSDVFESDESGVRSVPPAPPSKLLDAPIGG